jgi:ParB family chromosome partitioning protein
MTSRKKPVLGRNLSSMLSQATLQQVQSGAREALQKLPLDVIRPGRFQPRSVFDQEKLTELADSIRAQGVVQPIVVRPLSDSSGAGALRRSPGSNAYRRWSGTCRTKSRWPWP